MPTGTYTHAYLSLVSNLHARQILNGIVNVTNEDWTFMELMRIKGREVVTGNTVFRNFVNTDLYATETISGTVTDNSGGSGQGDITFDVASASGTSFPLPGELVQFPSGYLGYVVSNTADAGGDILRVKAVDSTVTTANLAAANAQVLSFYGQAAAAGAAGPSTRRYSPTSYTNQTMIFEHAFKVEDVEGGTVLEIDVNGQPYYVYQSMIDAQTKFMSDEAFLTFFSQISDANFSSSSPTLVDGESKPVQTTRGLRQYATTYGVNTSSITPTIAQFGTLERTLSKNRSPQEYDVYYGAEGAIAVDTLLNALGGSPDLENARYSVDGVDIELGGVRRARIHGRTYNFTKLSIFDHDKAVNFNGSAGYAKDIMFLPVGPVKTTDNGFVERVRIRYMQWPMQNGSHNNLRYQEINTGALAPVPTNDTNEWKQTLRSNFGPEVIKPQDMVLWELS